VLPPAVPPEIGTTLASVPDVSMTYAKMLVCTSSTTTADTPIGLNVTANSPLVTYLSPQLDASNPKTVSQLEKHPPLICTTLCALATNILNPGPVKLFNASDHVELPWSTMLATRRRRPLRSTSAPCPPETILPRLRRRTFQHL
jgi:hypothetical protein